MKSVRGEECEWWEEGVGGRDTTVERIRWGSVRVGESVNSGGRG